MKDIFQDENDSWRSLSYALENQLPGSAALGSLMSTVAVSTAAELGFDHAGMLRLRFQAEMAGAESLITTDSLRIEIEERLNNFMERNRPNKQQLNLERAILELSRIAAVSGYEDARNFAKREESLADAFERASNCIQPLR